MTDTVKNKSSVTIQSGLTQGLNVLNLDSVEEVFCLNVKFQQHLKRLESRKSKVEDNDDPSVIYEDNYVTMNYEMVDQGAQSTTVFAIDEPVYLD